MLNKIIKRDGTVEDFIPHKLNKWSQWASENLEDRANWSDVVLEAVSSLGTTAKSSELQDKLIKACVARNDWPHSLMAGRLYSANIHKEVFSGNIPTIKQLHTDLVKLGLMIELGYTDEEYEEIESIIDHTRDFRLSYFQIKHIMHKYVLQNRTEKKTYETPQFNYMRMAMALSSSDDPSVKLKNVERRYNYYSLQKINSPTPSHINLGTKSKGLASCCLYKADDNVESLGIGDYIALTMTAESAGIGGLINTRAPNDPVRGGFTPHRGKLPYFRSVAGAVHANTQGGRGGACTEYYSAFDPESITIAQLQNPKSTDDKSNRDIHFAMQGNRLLAKKVALNEDIFLFTSYSYPDLYEMLFSGDKDAFEELYNKYEKDGKPKQFINARKFIVIATQQSIEVATHYFAFMDEINRHTPFIEPIHSSNLCLEIVIPTAAYNYMPDLYKVEDNGVMEFIDFNDEVVSLPFSSKVTTNYKDGVALSIPKTTFAGNLKEGFDFKKLIKRSPTSEVGICSLASIPVCNIETDEEYEDVAYYCLKDITSNIHNTKYKLPHIGYTAKNRMNAGVGILGLAYQLAKEGIKYNSQEGFNRIHEIAERHAYFLIKASLRIAKEIGNAPWIHKTKWPDGWLPIDTYKSNVDSLVTVGLKYDWETLRQEIIAQGGIAHSSLIAHMPTESSSKAAGLPNGVYPIRAFTLEKSDQTNIIDWVAIDGDLLKDNYELAYDIPKKVMIYIYSIIQKFTDQAISADEYIDRSKDINVYTRDMCNDYVEMAKYGVKTRYYVNSKTSFDDKTRSITIIDNNDSHMTEEELAISSEPIFIKEKGCSSGVCDV